MHILFFLAVRQKVSLFIAKCDKGTGISLSCGFMTFYFRSLFFPHFLFSFTFISAHFSFDLPGIYSFCLPCVRLGQSFSGIVLMTGESNGRNL